MHNQLCNFDILVNLIYTSDCQTYRYMISKIGVSFTWNLQAGSEVISAVTTAATPRLAKLPRTKPQVRDTN